VFPTLASGASVEVTVAACVPRDFRTNPVTLNASATSGTTDPDSGNDSASVDVPLIASIFADGFDCP
jgi:hypothetical protein